MKSHFLISIAFFLSMSSELGDRAPVGYDFSGVRAAFMKEAP